MRGEGSPGSSDARAGSWELCCVCAPGRGSGALSAEGGPARWLARGVSQKWSEQCRKEKEREVVGGEERKKGRRKWREKERKEKEKEK